MSKKKPVGEAFRAILEVTAKEYVWRVVDKAGNEIARDRHVRTSYGSTGTAKASRFEDALGNYPDLLEAIGDCGFDVGDVMSALGVGSIEVLGDES